jgi:hypothetical protein
MKLSRALLKFQITISKFQISSKIQFQMTKIIVENLEFGTLKFICYLVIEIWCLFNFFNKHEIQCSI